MLRRALMITTVTACLAATVVASGSDAFAATSNPSPSKASSKNLLVERSVVRHVVRPSQNLSQIARMYGIDVKELASSNGIRNPNLVPAGKVLTVAVTLYGPRNLPVALRRSQERVSLIPTFESAARECRVPVDLLKSLAWVESGWQNTVVSASGAIGIGQLMPGTAHWVAARMGNSRLDPRRPADNVRMSACYLRFLLDRYQGDHRLALMAYNQGWGSMDVVGATVGARRYAAVIEAQRPRFL